MPVHVHVLLPCVSLLYCMYQLVLPSFFFYLYINACVHRPVWLKLEPVHSYRIISVFMHLQVVFSFKSTLCLLVTTMKDWKLLGGFNRTTCVYLNLMRTISSCCGCKFFLLHRNYFRTFFFFKFYSKMWSFHFLFFFYSARPPPLLIEGTCVCQSGWLFSPVSVHVVYLRSAPSCQCHCFPVSLMWTQPARHRVHARYTPSTSSSLAFALSASIFVSQWFTQCEAASHLTCGHMKHV